MTWAQRVVERTIERLQHYRMPVRFLRFVASRYTFRQTYRGVDATNEWVNRIDFSIDNVRRWSRGFRPGGVLGETTSIQTLFHEFTHAYLDLKENDPNVSRILAHARRHYRNAPMRNGRVTENLDRLVTEAFAGYVGNKASVFYDAFELLSFWKESLDRLVWRNEGVPNFDMIEREVANIPTTYNARMAYRVFGYDSGRFGFSDQNPTNRQISDQIRFFCDTEMLESKISPTFAGDRLLRDKHIELQRILRNSRNIIVFDVIR